MASKVKASANGSKHYSRLSYLPFFHGPFPLSRPIFLVLHSVCLPYGYKMVSLGIDGIRSVVQLPKGTTLELPTISLPASSLAVN